MDQSLHLRINHFPKLAAMRQAPASLYAPALLSALAANFQRNVAIDFQGPLISYEALVSSLCQSASAPAALVMHKRSWDSHSVKLSSEDPLKDFDASVVNLTILHANQSAQLVVNDAQLRGKMRSLLLASKWASSAVTRPPEGSSISLRHNLRLCLAHHLEASSGHLESFKASSGSASNFSKEPQVDAGAPISMIDEFCEFLKSAGAPIDAVDQYRKFLNYAKKSHNNQFGQRRSSHPSISSGRKNIANHTRFDYQRLSPACGSHGNRIAAHLKSRSAHDADAPSDPFLGSALSHPPDAQISDFALIKEADKSPALFDESGKLVNVGCASTVGADQEIADISHAGRSMEISVAQSVYSLRCSRHGS